MNARWTRAVPVPTLAELVERRQSRREVLGGGLLAASSFLFGGSCVRPAPSGDARRSRLGFRGVPVARLEQDDVVVPDGYEKQVLVRWGDAISGEEIQDPVRCTAAEQARRAGMHHDGMHFFPLHEEADPESSAHGLLAINHEYTDDGLLHEGGQDGGQGWSAERIAKSQAAHGVSIVEVRRNRESGEWYLVPDSFYARRLTGGWAPAAVAVDMAFDGPAAEPALHPLLGSRIFAGEERVGEGRRVFGTLGNCSAGPTPWGTFLTCEENFSDYFVAPEDVDDDIVARNIRAYSFKTRKASKKKYRWHEHDPRFDLGTKQDGGIAADYSYESHRYGWVVEVDPYDPQSTPIKHTALGRFKHEGATVTIAPDGRIVVYMGDDEKFQYIYKFVSAEAWSRESRASPLSRGTLYVARFDDSGSGEWLPLTVDALRDRLAPDDQRFRDQAEVLVFAREAAQVLGATAMDRPEWIAVDPVSGEVYCTLTNNVDRGEPGKEGVDRANPRAANAFGHILRWRESAGDASAASFEWDLFVLCGERSAAGDFACPDGLWLDRRGVLWIQTDAASKDLYERDGNTGELAFRGDFAFAGHNQMLALDPATREIRRFLTGPRGCEVTGITSTPDLQTLFVNIQHPGEPPNEANQSSPEDPAISSWPSGGTPRSATVAIWKIAGGAVGS